MIEFCIVTRYWKGHRDRSFEIANASVEAQDYPGKVYHIVVEMPDHPVGIKAANALLGHTAELVKGDLVILMDDDDYLMRKTALSELAQDVEDHKERWSGDYTMPDIIFARGLYVRRKGEGEKIVLPPDSMWTKKPQRGKIGGQCCIASTKLYREHIHHYAKDAVEGDYGGSRDFSYITACWENSKRVIWHDKIVVAQQRFGGGKTDAENGVV